jgi:hypothetical protein
MKRFNMNKFIGPCMNGNYLINQSEFPYWLPQVIIIHYFFDKRENESWNAINYAKLPSFS